MASILRGLGWTQARSWRPFAVLMITLLSVYFALFVLTYQAAALTTVPTKMNFQGRLADSTGNIKANGSYNMRLKLYTVSSGGTAVWSEDRLVSSGAGVTVTNGLFSIQLGTLTTLPASLFASGSLYLEVEFPTPATATSTTPTWTEGAMSPRNQMATSAYAFNSELLDGQDGAYYQDAANLTGTIASAQIVGSYTGITGTGALTAGSIASGFGSILTTNSIQGSQLVAKATTTNAATLVLQKTDGSIGLEVRTGGLGDNTIYVGTNTGTSRTTGVDNLAFGSFALQSNTTGSYNTAFGNYALQSNISGQGNIAFGGSALNINTAGSNNVAFGTEALYNTTTSQSTAVGFRALKTQTTGDGNTAIGSGADVSVGTIAKSTAIGYNAIVSQSNSLVLGGTGADSVQVGIGTTAPAETLDVQGGNIRTSGRLISTVATGTAPITVASTTKVTNLNADLLDGLDSTSFVQLSTANTFSNANSIQATSTTALRVQSAAGANTFLTVDTSGSQITIGNAAADSVAVLFRLDDKNTAGDPTGVAGAMYYNSNAGKFRCYQAGAWTDCIGAGGGGGTLQNAYDNSSSPATITTTAAKGVKIVTGAAPTTDIFSVSNTGFGVTTDNVNGIDVNYVGGAAAVEGAGVRVDYTPGGSSGGEWSGVRIVSNATGAASGVNGNGLKLEGPTTPGTGTDTGLNVGTGWDIGVDIQSGGMQLAAGNDPATPTAGNLRIYAKDIAGRMMPKWVGPSGVDTPFQANLGFNRVSMITPAGGGTGTTFIGGFGSTFTNVATSYSNPVLATTNLLTSTRRATFTGTATAGTMLSHRQSVLQVTRGNAAGIGGFFYTTRFATSTLAAGNRAFVGLSGSIAAPTNVDPTTSAAIGKIGLAINANTGNWQFVTNTAGSVPTPTDLGATIPVDNTSLYELVLFSAPNGSSIGYRVKNLSTGNTVSGSASSNLPGNTTFLSPQLWMTNNATAGAIGMDLGGWYLESDQ